VGRLANSAMTSIRGAGSLPVISQSKATLYEEGELHKAVSDCTATSAAFAFPRCGSFKKRGRPHVMFLCPRSLGEVGDFRRRGRVGPGPGRVGSGVWSWRLESSCRTTISLSWEKGACGALGSEGALRR
jgi:hypothetical protein